MSDAAVDPADSPAGELAPPAASLWLLLRTTPLSDALRGRLTGALSANYIIACAGLPGPLQTLVRDVVGRSRLWRSERAEVARELIAHFADGLDAGRSSAQLMADFGDPAQAARLIRRAARRNRPLPWRAMRFTLRAAAFVGIASIALYAVMTLRFHLGRPGPIADLRPELNTAAVTVSDSERAWPLYREALLRLPKEQPDAVINSRYSRQPLPGEAGWETIDAYLDQARDALDFARRAAERRGMGLVVGYPLDEADAALWPELTDAAEHEFTSPESQGVVGVLLPHLSLLRRLAITLGWDVQRAADDDDTATALANLRAIFALARHTRETPIVINELVSLSILSMARERIDHILAARPELFSDAQLVDLAHALAAFDDRAMRVRLDGERVFFRDAVQRMYTDDGSGDGRMTPRGLRWLDHLGPFTGQPDRLQDALIGLGGPGIAALVAGRRDMSEQYERLMNMLEAEALQPLWERETSQADRIVEQWAGSTIDRVRYLPLVLTLPALSKATVQSELACQKRDATITAIALELHRRRHGEWPATLEQLVPSMMPALPIDRFDGQPLRYRLVDGRPLLYSVGTDRDDDGGALPLRASNASPQWYAQHWIPRDQLADRLRSSQFDGDWILWPPLPPDPLYMRDE